MQWYSSTSNWHKAYLCATVQVTDVCSMFASAALPQWQERHRLVARWLAPCFFLQV